MWVSSEFEGYEEIDSYFNTLMESGIDSPISPAIQVVTGIENGFQVTQAPRKVLCSMFEKCKHAAIFLLIKSSGLDTGKPRACSSSRMSCLHRSSAPQLQSPS